MLKIVEKLWESLRRSLWESCEKVFNKVWDWFGLGGFCEKVEKFSKLISTGFGNGFSLLEGGFCTFST